MNFASGTGATWGAYINAAPQASASSSSSTRNVFQTYLTNRAASEAEADAPIWDNVPITRETTDSADREVTFKDNDSDVFRRDDVTYMITSSDSPEGSSSSHAGRAAPPTLQEPGTKEKTSESNGSDTYHFPEKDQIAFPKCKLPKWSEVYAEDKMSGPMRTQAPGYNQLGDTGLPSATDRKLE